MWGWGENRLSEAKGPTFNAVQRIYKRKMHNNPQLKEKKKKKAIILLTVVRKPKWKGESRKGRSLHWAQIKTLCPGCAGLYKKQLQEQTCRSEALEEHGAHRDEPPRAFQICPLQSPLLCQGGLEGTTQTAPVGLAHHIKKHLRNQVRFNKQSQKHHMCATAMTVNVLLQI